MREVKVAVVAPAAYRGSEEYRNAAQAVSYIEEAAVQGAQLVLFPEGYPGPCNGPMDSGGKLPATPIAMLQEAAKKHRVYVSCGDLEETGILPDTYYLCQNLISPQGEILANYRRCQPTPPDTNAYLYSGRRHVLPGDELMVVGTEVGKLGLIICSEIFVPELARVEMLMGAEVLLAPIGGSYGRKRMTLQVGEFGPHPRAMMNLWKCVAQARAAENLMYVLITANIWEKDSSWGSCIAGPERILAESEGAGIIYATLDMGYLLALRSRCRSEEDYAEPPVIVPPVVCPGQNRDRVPSCTTNWWNPSLMHSTSSITGTGWTSGMRLTRNASLRAAIRKVLGLWADVHLHQWQIAWVAVLFDEFTACYELFRLKF